MVIMRILFLFIFFLHWQAFAEQPQISASVDQYQTLSVNSPFKVTILITHLEKEAIDESSFSIDKKPIKAVKVRDDRIGKSDQIISIYKVQMPGSPKGIQELPSISVKVANQTIFSTPSTYVVTDKPQLLSPIKDEALPESESQEAQKTFASPPSPPSLHLEQEIEGLESLYPGKRARFIYRYIISGDIELTKEDLPLLDAKGFLKVGKPELHEYARDGKSVYEISQEVEAIKPGVFPFDPANVEGVARLQDIYGRYSYYPDHLRSSTEKISIEVKPFPTIGKPASFVNASGQFDFQVKLISSADVAVGDVLKLEILVTGGTSQELENIQLPKICCQPGISGFFNLGSLPPAGKIEGGTKLFHVDLRPLSSEVKEIPPLEFSFFDQKANQFKTIKSRPIPISVHELTPAEEIEGIMEHKAQEKPIVFSKKPKPFEMTVIYNLSETDLKDLPFGTFMVLWAIPIGIGVFFFLSQLKRKRALKLAAVNQETLERGFL